MSVHLFDFDGSPEVGSPESYGQRYWGVYLADGRKLFFHADKVVISSTGDLIAVRTHEPALFAGAPTYDYTPLADSYSTLGFASGQWLSYFSASVLNGDPVAVDNSEKYV